MLARRKRRHHDFEFSFELTISQRDDQSDVSRKGDCAYMTQNRDLQKLALIFGRVWPPPQIVIKDRIS